MMMFYIPFHLVSVSPWPFLGSFGSMNLLLGVLDTFNSKDFFLFLFSGLFILLVAAQWWRDVIREGLWQGCHTLKVVSGLKLGMLLFIMSELMLFVSFFWAYFHFYLAPSVELGGIFPSFNICVFDPMSIPLLNTVILLGSGVTITWGHHSALGGNKFFLKLSVLLTLLLGGVFTVFQYLEYCEAFFTLGDSSYGSIFFLATGFHGLHVLIGTIFILVNLYRIVMNQFSSYHHCGFEMSIWYWHFVDVVWLFLYLFIYWLSY
uniref:Cytochrome c oxidase subunit 3 n=1 Tax=Elasmosoma sp. QL-2014 TaxID=1491720 RepID=A0A0U1WZ38_9HYME|nr:cytochrome c oxidase subunit III [Elasmosoma sp. QL-2014]